MKILLFCVVAFVAYIAGVFGFAQIVGSLQNVRERGAVATAVTMVIWVAVLAVVAVAAHYFFYPQRWAYYIATGVALVQMLAAGKMR